MARISLTGVLLSTGLVALISGCSGSADEAAHVWTDKERALIGGLSLSALPALPPDPSNRVADDPAAARLGEALFFDTRLSANGEVACATCHLPDRQFQDGLPLGRGMGTTGRRTMPIAGTAYAPFLFWDGRRDSQWAQALGPLESAVEHGTDRVSVARLIATDYPEPYEAVFGPLPDVAGLPSSASPLGNEAARAAWEGMTAAEQDQANRVFANLGKAIAAFERKQLPQPGRFDAFADAIAKGDDIAANAMLSATEQRGLALFVGGATCVNCHNGPLLSDHGFHNIGVPAAPDLPADVGRAKGARDVEDDPFNCLGRYSDAKPEECAELMFMVAEGEDLIGAFKTPSLRGVTARSPFMHAGQFASIKEILAHYNTAPSAAAGHSELKPLGLSEDDLEALEAFLRAVDDQLEAAAGG